MNFSEEQKVVTPDWSYHIEQSKKHKGSFVSYCREQAIDYAQFMYYKDQFKNKTEKVAAKVAQVGFAKVKVEAGGQNKNHQQLPDPKWLSEFIHNFMRVR